jgi:hypothetical protein
MGVEIPNIVKPADIQAELYPEVRWFQQNYPGVNQFPIMTRVQRQPVGTQTFVVRHKRYRPRRYPIAATTSLDTAAFSILTLTSLAGPTGVLPGTGDVTSLMNGDILDYAGERVEVMMTPAADPGQMPVAPPGVVTLLAGAPRPAAGTVIVRRGVGGTTIAAHAAGVVGKLVGNSRDGGEVNQPGIRSRPIEVTQTVQNWELPVQVSGAVESESGAYGLAAGSQFQAAKAEQFDNMMRDMEYSSLYGKGVAPQYYGDGSQARMQQIGIKYQIVTNQVTATSGSAYTPDQFISDALVPLWNVGAAPDILMANAKFLGGLSKWSRPSTRIDVGQTEMGVRIEVFETNLAPGLMIVPNYNMEDGEIYVGSSNLLFWRVKYGESFWPRGTRGYAYEGDWVAEGAIEVRDEEKHLWLTGITGYST